MEETKGNNNIKGNKPKTNQFRKQARDNKHREAEEEENKVDTSDVLIPVGKQFYVYDYIKRVAPAAEVETVSLTLLRKPEEKKSMKETDGWFDAVKAAVDTGPIRLTKKINPKKEETYFVLSGWKRIEDAMLRAIDEGGPSTIKAPVISKGAMWRCLYEDPNAPPKETAAEIAKKGYGLTKPKKDKKPITAIGEKLLSLGAKFTKAKENRPAKAN